MPSTTAVPLHLSESSIDYKGVPELSLRSAQLCMEPLRTGKIPFMESRMQNQNDHIVCELFLLCRDTLLFIKI